MLLHKNIPYSYTVKKVWREMLIVFIISTVIVFVDRNFNTENYAMPLSISAVLGTAISLVLAFRTAQGYERWWEARKIWGSIVNDSRTLGRQVLYYDMPSDSDEKRSWQVKVIKRHIGWCYALVNSLRRIQSSDNYSEYLLEEEYNRYKNHDNIPNAILVDQQQDLKTAVSEGYISELQQINFDETLRRLTDHMGKCERIKNTVFPTMYEKYTRFLIFLFLVFLALGMVDYLGYVEGPVVIIVALAFFLLEKTAVILQDPFENRPSDIDILNISTNIDRSLRQMMGESELPEKVKPHEYYTM